MSSLWTRQSNRRERRVTILRFLPLSRGVLALRNSSPKGAVPMNGNAGYGISLARRPAKLILQCRTMRLSAKPVTINHRHWMKIESSCRSILLIRWAHRLPHQVAKSSCFPVLSPILAMMIALDIQVGWSRLNGLAQLKSGIRYICCPISPAQSCIHRWIMVPIVVR